MKIVETAFNDKFDIANDPDQVIIDLLDLPAHRRGGLWRGFFLLFVAATGCQQQAHKNKRGKYFTKVHDSVPFENEIRFQ